MKSLEIWGELQREIGAETGFRRTGLLYVTTRPADFAQWEGWTLKAREYQMHSRVLSAAEAKAMTPGSTPDWIGGVHSPTDGRAEPSLAVPGHRRGARAGSVPRSIRTAPRAASTSRPARSRASSPSRASSARRPCCWPAVRGAACSAAATACGLPQASVTLDLVRHQGSARGDRRRPVDARRHHPPPARRRLHGGAGRARPGRAVAAGPAPCPPVLADLKKRWAGVTLGIGRSFFDGPESFARWSFDGPSPFERHRTLDPAADPEAGPAAA